MKIFFGLCFLVFSLGCSNYGSMLITLEPSATAIETGETVTFSVGIPAGQKLSSESTLKILDSDDAQFGDLISLNEVGLFEYTFKAADSYHVAATIITDRDYGYVSTDIFVEYSGIVPDWGLSDDNRNPTSFMGRSGEVVGFYLDALFVSGVESIDVKLLHEKTDSVLFYQKNVARFMEYIHIDNTKTGSVKFISYLNFDDGNSLKITDQLVILDPNNPVEILFSASKDDESYPDTIFLSGSLEIIGASGTFENVYLERTSYYGKEAGIHPLAEPLGDPNSDDFYTKTGQPLIARQEIYYAIQEGLPVEGSLLKYDSTLGGFEFTDPMPYYDENGGVEELGFKWSYAKFDREAWKYIKRNQYFDLEKAVTVEYKLVAQAKVDSEVKPFISSDIQKGVPFLSKIPYAQFCMWIKEVALNRLWHMQVPRYCFSKTFSWLSSPQDHNGGVSGNIYYTINRLTQSGSGAIKDYSDWPGIKISTNKNIAVNGSIATNVKRTHDLDVTIETPIWSKTRFEIKGLGIRDYVLQWGYWITDGDYSGELHLTRLGGSVEVVNKEEIKTFMPTWNVWLPEPGYGYELGDATGQEDVESAFRASWTKINFLYPPTPGDYEFGVWESKPEQWDCYYKVIE